MPRATGRPEGVRSSSINAADILSGGSKATSRILREKDLWEREQEFEREKERWRREMEGMARCRMVEAKQEAGLMLDDEDDAWVPAEFENGIVSDDEEGGKAAEEEDDDESSSDESTDEGEGENRLYSKKPRRQKHNRTDDNAALHKEWARIAPDLLVAYLEHLAQEITHPADSADVHHFKILVFGADKAYQTVVPQRSEDSAAVALARIGCLPGHPTRPRVAFEIRGLEQHRQLRMALPSCTAMPWMKAVCQLSNMKYRESLRESFGLALDAYLAILRDVQKLVDKELGRDEKDWYAKYACPPCGNKLPGEKKMDPERMHASDGNESQKRLLNSGHTDHRDLLPPTFWISPEDVDKFADEVKRRDKGKKKKKTEEEEEEDDGVCPSVQTWKAERAQAEDVAYTAIFKQTGVYLCSCRHGIVEFIEQMIQSGEQAKYCLAVADRILEIYGEDQLLATDIGCSMKETIKKSSLGNRMATLRLRVVVNAFHGWAHKRECQLYNHPLFLKGLGIEDLEVCERIFSSLNGVAHAVRHASHFHYIQFITLHLDGLRRDKYGALTKFMRNNHRQSIKIIADNTKLLAARKETSKDYVSWLEDERAYYKALRKESPLDQLKTKYAAVRLDLEVQQLALQKFEATPARELATRVLGAATAPHLLESYKERERIIAYRKLTNLDKRAAALERDLGIERWDAKSPEFLAAQQYAVQRKLILAVQKLERLLVARLQELSRSHLRRVGYKERKHLAKAITRRGSAIRNAITNVNRLRAIHRPGAPKLSYKEVVDMGYSAELDVLKESSHDILHKPWMDRKNREAQTAFFKLERAKEELDRLHHEIPRMQDWVDKEDDIYDSAIERLRGTPQDSSLGVSPRGLAVYLEREAAARRIQNDEHRRVLDEIYRDKSYTGPRPPPTHVYRPRPRALAFRSSIATRSSPKDGMDVDEEAGMSVAPDDEESSSSEDEADEGGDDVEGIARDFGDLLVR
ncbi:unnamed protein product [Peniophora sp. CBMAI 1063]|nr:unnamed protein product [Peniophora sp. CBMAI 1063]